MPAAATLKTAYGHNSMCITEFPSMTKTQVSTTGDTVSSSHSVLIRLQRLCFYEIIYEVIDDAH